MRLRANATVLGYNAGDPILIDDDDEAGLAAIAPYLAGGHVVTEDEVEVTVVLTPEATAAALKGKALDAALRDAGLPVTGTAPEKRAALVAALTDHDGNDDGDGSDGEGSDGEGSDGPTE